MRNLYVQSASFTIISALFIVFVFGLARQSRISFRYAIGWIVLFAPGLLSIVLLPLINPISTVLAVSPGAFFAVGFMTILIGICIQLSISISGLQEQIRCLSEEIAQLRFQADKGKN